SRLTTNSAIEVSGTESSGEVEFVLVRHREQLYVGVGSDHTDRKVETYSVTVSKQMCEKPIAPSFWPYEAVKLHWDSLILRSWRHTDGGQELYQEGQLHMMLKPEELINKFDHKGLPEGTAMFCGTLAARGGIKPAPRFSFELVDPIGGRRIRHAYDVLSL